MMFYVTKARRVINCSQCRAETQEESSVAVGEWFETMADLEQVVNRSAPRIPVGWSMNGRYDLRCTTCTG